MTTNDSPLTPGPVDSGPCPRRTWDTEQSLTRGIADAERGDLVDLGSFARYSPHYKTEVSSDVIGETLDLRGADGSVYPGINWTASFAHDPKSGGCLAIHGADPTNVLRAANAVVHAIEADNPSHDAEDLLACASVRVIDGQTFIYFPNLTTD